MLSPLPQVSYSVVFRPRWRDSLFFKAEFSNGKNDMKSVMVVEPARVISAWVVYWGPRRKLLPPGAQAETHGFAPSLQLISNYVSESLGTAGGRGGQKVQDQQEQDISSVLPGSSQGFMDNQWTLKEKIWFGSTFDLALGFMQNF